jgi:hypothetical protein
MGNSEKLDNIKHTRRGKTKQTHRTICVENHHTPTNTNNVSKTWTLIQTTGGKDEPNIVSMRNRNGHHGT